MKNLEYKEVYSKSVYDDWENFNIKKNELEKKILDQFEKKPILKLVGSAAVGTMRKNAEDFDYAVAFEKPMNQQEFLRNLTDAGLELGEVNIHKTHGYMRATGQFENFDFVFVPTVNPNGEIKSYEQDAFYHPEFINSLRNKDHQYNTILAKEFFSQLNLYKKVKGIGSELLILKYSDFDNMLKSFVENDSLRVNFSPKDVDYSSNPLVIDYPYLGHRSFTEKVTKEDYIKIQENAESILKDSSFFIGRKV